MSYVQTTLGANEQVVMNARVSYFAFITHYIFIFIFLSLSVEMIYFAVIAVLDLLYVLATIFTTELALTDKRVIAKFGIIRRSAIELRFEKVESITINQGILARIFNYGTICINSAGSTAPIPCISKPFEFKKKADEYIQK